MKNKMAEKRNILGGGAFVSRLNSFKFQNKCGILFFTAQNSLTTKSIKAFSIAEAMIALLIGTIVLGFSAPMISRQLKHNNYSDAQAQIISKRIDKLIESNNALKQEIETLKKSSGGVPKGTVAFFNNTVEPESETNPCPKGWSLIESNWQGRFPRFSGTNLILEYDTVNKIYKETGVEETLSVGQIQEDAIRNITGRSGDFEGEGTTVGNNGAISTLSSSGGWEGGHWATRHRLEFDASLVVPISTENRPKAVALLGCVKN